MDETVVSIVLGSRSPRRLELLSTIFPREQITVLPPENSEEPGFDGLTTIIEFEQQILKIVEIKQQDVLRQLADRKMPGRTALICADTIVIVEDATGVLLALGQPPRNTQARTVREWFKSYLAGRPHTVMSGVSVTRIESVDGVIDSQNLITKTSVCSTQVTMREDVDAFLDWYISTGEPAGKAGGYAIQGAGSIFVTKIEGSYSNVVGMPLEDTISMLREFEVLS